MSRQAFLRKIGKKVRRVSETQEYHNVTYTFAYHVYGISALGIAGTHSQLCIVDSKYRYIAGKKKFNQLAHHACTHIYGEFSSQKGTCLNKQVITVKSTGYSWQMEGTFKCERYF